MRKLLLLILLPVIVLAQSWTSTRVGADDWQCQDAAGNRISGHTRQDTAFASCSNLTLHDGVQRFVVPAKYSVARSSSSSSSSSAASSSSSSVSSSSSSSSLQLLPLASTSFQYLGTFSVPDGFGDVIGYAGNNQFISANHSTSQLRFYNIPAIGGTATQVGSTTATLPSWGNVENGWWMSGPVRVNGRVLAGRYQNYSNNDDPAMVQSIAGDLSGSWTARQKPQAYSGVPLRGIHGQFGVIPAEYRSLFGGADVFAFNLVAKSIVSNNSLGPSFLPFSTTSVTGSGTIPSQLLMGYYSGGYDPPLPAEALVTENHQIQFGGFVKGTNTFLAVGMDPGSFCYGSASSCRDTCPNAQEYGNHSYPYTLSVWAFDIQQFVDVKNGTRQRHQVRPYGTSNTGILGSPKGYPLPISDSCFDMYTEIGFIDPDTNRIYVTKRGDNLVHVFQITL